MPGTSFVADFVPKVEALQVGDPADPSTDVGPVITEDERDRILEWIRESHGDVLAGGDTTGDGLIRPTVIANPSPQDKVQCEEVFGPGGHADAHVEPRRRDRLGRTPPVTAYRRRSSRAICRTSLEAARRLEFGGVIVNEAPTFRADQMPYGGVKASGNTKEGPGWTVREMTEERLVVLQL